MKDTSKKFSKKEITIIINNFTKLCIFSKNNLKQDASQ